MLVDQPRRTAVAPSARQRALKWRHRRSHLPGMHGANRAAHAVAAAAIAQVVGLAPHIGTCRGGQRAPHALAAEEQPPRHKRVRRVFKHQRPDLINFGQF